MKLTPTENRIYNALCDWRPHRAVSLANLLEDDLADPATLRVHIANLRRKLVGVSIACRGGWYFFVRNPVEDD